jgi:hypothetical protein
MFKFGRKYNIRFNLIPRIIVGYDPACPNSFHTITVKLTPEEESQFIKLMNQEIDNNNEQF